MPEQKSDFHGGFIVTATVDPASLATDAIGNTDVTVAGILSTDRVVALPPVDLEAGLVVQGCTVPAADTIRVRINNLSAGTVNGASKTWEFMVFRR